MSDVVNGAPEDNLAGDMLRGAPAIAKFTGFSKRQVYHALMQGYIPAFKIGETWCSRKSTIRAHIESQEALAASRSKAEAA